VSVADSSEEAQRHFELGYRAQMAGRLEEAITAYKQSIAVRPTAEAHTFLGWTYSFQKRWDEAIAECHAAIDVDPDFGNPYNDIGVYAKRARRYEPRHYPYFNLARIFAAQHKVREAVRELEHAIALHPNYRAARTELHRLIGLLN